MPRHSRTWASFLSAGALALTLAACSGDDEPAAEPATDGPRETTSAPPTEPPTEPPTDPAASEPVTDPEVAAFLERSRNGLGEKGSAHVRLKLTGPVESVAEGDSAYGPEGSEMRLRMSLPEMGGAELEMLSVDGATYLAMPGVTPPGKYFEVPEGSAGLGAMAGGAGGLSPADSFAGIEAGLERVEERGREKIGGQPADRFELHVDTAASMAAMDVGAPTAGLPETLVYDVWLDRQDRMRRVRYELAGTTMTMDLTDWGKPFSVTAPARKDLVEPPPGL
jgi:hypothetical protein